jgi:hypothetical protein
MPLEIGGPHISSRYDLASRTVFLDRLKLYMMITLRRTLAGCSEVTGALAADR